MKPKVLTILLLMFSPVVTRAEEFSDRLSAAEKRAAGLDQLGPEQLATLNALVKREREGGEQRLREQVRAEVTAVAKEQARTEVRREEKEKRIAESRVLSRITGRYDGWSRGTVFQLENGQVWRHTGSEVRYVNPVEAPPVLIEKVFGGWRFFDAGGGWCPVERIK